MYRVALIQNQSEMSHYGYADARPLLQEFGYNTFLYTAENIGKIAAHASLEAYKKADSSNIEAWENDGQKKVVLKVSGGTEVEPGTATCVGIRPGKGEKIDYVAGKLKLF